MNPGITTGSPCLHQFVGGNSLDATLGTDMATQFTCTSCVPTKDFSNYWISALYFKARTGPISLKSKQLRENSPQCDFKGVSIRVQPIVRLPQRPKLSQVKCINEHRINMAEFSSRLSQRSSNHRPHPSRGFGLAGLRASLHIVQTFAGIRAATFVLPRPSFP